MVEFKARDNNIYDTFGGFLSRKGIKNSYSMAYLLIDKFVLNNDNEYQRITSDELKDRGIITKQDYKTFIGWRENMMKMEVLICMANRDELKQEVPNHKGNYFKVGLLILKHIEKIRIKLLPEKFKDIYSKFTSINNSLDKSQENFNIIDSNFGKVDIRLEKMQEQIDGMLELFFEVMPPNSQNRRKIIQENFKDKYECLRLLRKTIN